MTSNLKNLQESEAKFKSEAKPPPPTSSYLKIDSDCQHCQNCPTVQGSAIALALALQLQRSDFGHALKWQRSDFDHALMAVLAVQAEQAVLSKLELYAISMAKIRALWLCLKQPNQSKVALNVAKSVNSRQNVAKSVKSSLKCSQIT